MDNISVVEKIIGYKFKDKALLLRAFTHSSFVNENQNFVDYERLEFVGDAFLNFAVAVYLYNTYPTYSEGELTKLRANLVSAQALGKVVESLNILKYVKTGAGLQVNEAKNIKSDLFEAIIGAMIIDNAYDTAPAKNFVLKNLSKVSLAKTTDYKSKILEYCAKNSLVAQFDVESHQLINNENTFVVSLSINGKAVSCGRGGSKKSAEQEASKVFYKNIFSKSGK